MEQVYSHLSALQQECIQLCEELRDCLKEERRLLVEFEMDGLPQNTLRKESLVGTIGRKRQELRDYLRLRFDVEDATQLEERLPRDFVEEWKAAAGQWESLWKITRAECESNQRFLEHSVRNLGHLVDNLKHVFGEGSVYGKKGQKVDLQSEGKVLQGKY